MKLTISVPAEDYEHTTAQGTIDCRLGEVVIEQEDGLLNVTRRALSVIPISGIVAQKTGMPEGAGVAVRIWLTEPKEEHD